MRKRFLVPACALLLAAIPALADSWTTLQGVRFDGRLVQVYGDIAVFTRENGSAILPVNSLDDASLLKVADFLVLPPAKPGPWDRSTSKVAKGLANRLQVLQGTKLVNYKPGNQPEPEFYLVYFGAHWCPPCRRFSPTLLETYQRLKAIAPERFEVIYVSDDRDSSEQYRYITELKMPWPVVKYSSAGQIPVLDQWRGGGIPCLVVLTRDGDLLYHSYRGKEYLGADDPLEKFAALLEIMEHGAQASRSPDRHRLAVAQHARAAGGSRPPQPYLIPIRSRQLRALDVPGLVARLQLDPKGRVTDAEFSPPLSAAVDDMLRRETENWLFLPQVTDGQVRESVIQLPLNLQKD